MNTEILENLGKDPNQRPLANANPIYSCVDLSSMTYLNWCRATDPSHQPFDFLVGKHKNEVLEGLMLNSLYAASYCRLSGQISSRCCGESLKIRCEQCRNDQDISLDQFGMYVQILHVELIKEGIAT